MEANDFVIRGLLMQDGWPLLVKTQSSMVVEEDGQLMGNNFLAIELCLEISQH